MRAYVPLHQHIITEMLTTPGPYSDRTPRSRRRAQTAGQHIVEQLFADALEPQHDGIHVHAPETDAAV